MRIFVQPVQRRPDLVEADEAVILLGDGWNDFSFRTLYMAYLQRGGVHHRIGWVKILQRDQHTGLPPLAVGELSDGRLDDSFASLGGDLDYYRRLLELGLGSALPVALNDVAIDATRREAFANEEGFQRSLLRDHIDPTAYYAEILALLSAPAPAPEPSGLAFAFTPAGSAEPIGFDFTPPPQAQANAHPSTRIVVLVGTNGVGKTRLLARLARVAYAPPGERADLAADGAFDTPMSFPNIIAVSYSAFDTFAPPDLVGDEVTEVANQLTAGTGRYSYCGTRDLAALIKSPDQPVPLLGSAEQAALFAERIDQIRDRDRWLLFGRTLRPALADASFAAVRERVAAAYPEAADEALDDRLLADLLGDDPAAAFERHSSGHKIVLHVLASLVATMQPAALALIDEPETHLHPPLLAAFMAGLRHLLDTLGAHAIIATHSPVVAQETLAAQVLIVEGGGDAILVRPPTIETYGENIGTLTREIFGLHTGATDFRSVLDHMVDTYKSVEAIEAGLGTLLSSQALAHVMARLARQA